MVGVAECMKFWANLSLPCQVLEPESWAKGSWRRGVFNIKRGVDKLLDCLFSRLILFWSMGERVGRVGDLTSRLIDFFFFFPSNFACCFSTASHMESYHTNTESVKKAAVQGGGAEGKRSISAVFCSPLRKKTLKLHTDWLSSWDGNLLPHQFPCHTSRHLTGWFCTIAQKLLLWLVEFTFCFWGDSPKVLSL